MNGIRVRKKVLIIKFVVYGVSCELKSSMAVEGKERKRRAAVERERERIFTMYYIKVVT